MKFFSVPADFKKETIDKYHQLNTAYEDSKIIETYGNITVGNLIESGRSVELLPEIDLFHFKEYVRYSLEKDIDFNYTINASHMHSKEFTRRGMLDIITFLGELYDAGVRSLTVTLPSLMDIIKSTHFDFKIKCSVICQITTSNKATFYKNIGVERIVVDEAVYRDFQTLKRIRQVFNNMEIIVNTICHKDCPGRMFHYNQIATDSIKVSSDASANYYAHRCLMRRYENPANLLRLNWIRPEDLKYYARLGINYFKLQGRQSVLKGDPVRTVESYFKESFDGDLMELLDMFSPTSNFRIAIDNKSLDGFIEAFYNKENFCKHDCQNCHYCDRFAQQCISAREVKDVYRTACKFYNEYDQFNKLIESINRSNKSREKKSWDVDFDLG